VLLKLLLKINQTSTHSENESLIENGPYLKRDGGGCCAKEEGGGAAGCCAGREMGPTTAAIMNVATAAAQVTAVACGGAGHASTVTAQIHFTPPEPRGS
jgi:hypothetical protein